ncbi:MAG TPA: TonB-dependent receptor [Acidobacteriaceae bacterium]|nr:TonB-dependent receptor [Acidobacteriaceae bacterium]
MQRVGTHGHQHQDNAHRPSCVGPEREAARLLGRTIGVGVNRWREGFPKGFGPTGFGYNVYRNNRGGSLDDVQQFSSSMVLDSRFGLVFHPFGLAYPGNVGYDLSALGISGTGLPYTSFPGESSSDGYAGLAPGAGGQVSEDTTGSLEEILTKTFGHHTVRFGFEGNLIRYNVQNPQSGFGAFSFDRRFTQLNSVNVGIGSDPNSGDPMASLLLGDFSGASYNITPAYALQQIYMAPFVQDDWRVNNKLTLNLGIRYDYESPFTERYNKQVSNFCTTCTSPLQSSVVGLTLNGGLQYTGSSNRYPYPRDLNNIQPRLGAAYQVTPGTVVRAGFGIIYFNTLETPIGTGFSQSTSYTNTSNSAPTNTLSNPFPSGVVLPTGSSLGLATSLGQGVSFIDPHHVQPKSAQYTASVQQQFPGNLALQIAYVGARPTRLEVNHNINVLPAQYYLGGTNNYAAQIANITNLTTTVANPMAGKFSGTTSLNNATIQRYLLLLPFPEFGSVTEQYSSIGTAPYNALQVQVSKPMRHGFSIQGNFTWDKVMLHNGYLDNYAATTGHLDSVQDGNPTMFGNIFGIYEFPKFAKRPLYERLLIGGWQLQPVARLTNGPLVGVPGSIDIVGNPVQGNQSYTRTFNTCYQTVNSTTGAIANANTVISSTTGLPTSTACDAQSPNPAFRQRLNTTFTIQTNSTVLPVRQHIHSLLDASLFKTFAIREGMSFEIRGEFFNILNTANFGGPSTSLGAANFGSVASTSGLLTQINDPRIGQLTARINF